MSPKPQKTIKFELGGDENSKTASQKSNNNHVTVSEPMKGGGMTIRKQKGAYGASMDLMALGRKLEKK